MSFVPEISYLLILSFGFAILMLSILTGLRVQSYGLSANALPIGLNSALLVFGDLGRLIFSISECIDSGSEVRICGSY